MRKFIIITLLLSLFINLHSSYVTSAETSEKGLDDLVNENEIVYQIYDENKNFLFEKLNVEIGDIFIDKIFFVYEITIINKDNQTAIAKLSHKISKPKIEKNNIQNINIASGNKKIGIYMTHNDESYINGDGKESIYGKGGIHDIAKELSNNLKTLGVDTTFDETLHIPHNSSAYSRSSITASKLIKENPDAIFDIHRDGASRSSYVKKVNGIEKCQIMIVVGQANPNKQQNLEFALYLMAVAEQIYPWLFKDIYFAKGHYNQNLKNKALLFECGSHYVEKSLVKQTIPYLAKTIATTLYNTTINEDGSLKINSDNLNSETTINSYLEENKQNPKGYTKVFIIITVLFSFGLICYVLYRKVHLDNKNKL